MVFFVRGKIQTLFDHIKRTVTAHKQPGVGFILLKFQNRVKIIRNLRKQRKIVLDIAFRAERIFCQKDRQLRLHAECGTERFIVKQKLRCTQLRFQIIQKNIVGELPPGGQFFIIKFQKRVEIILQSRVRSLPCFR